MRDEETLKLVGQIYDAVGEPSGWIPFLDSLGSALNAHATRLRMTPRQGAGYKLIAGTGHNDSFEQQHRDYYLSVDPWTHIMAKLATAEVQDSTYVTSDREIVKTEIYNDFLRHYDTFYLLSGNIVNDNQYHTRINIHRSHAQGSYSPRDKQLLRTLLPHLQRALKLGTHFEVLSSKLSETQNALYHLTTPLILFDNHGRAVFVSQRAEVHIGNGSGLFINNGCLHARHSEDHSLLQSLINQAVSTSLGKGIGSGGAIRIRSQSGDQSLNLIVTPYPSRTASSPDLNTHICAALFIHDVNSRQAFSEGILHALYGITPAETRLAEALIHGLTPAEAAEKLGVAISTIRRQLRFLFAKTDTQRQAELLQLLSGLTDTV